MTTEDPLKKIYFSLPLLSFLFLAAGTPENPSETAAPPTEEIQEPAPEQASEPKSIYEQISESAESLIHTVKPGDTLYEIAKKYKTTVELLMKGNSLKDWTIFPDMKLKVVTGTFSIQVDKTQNVLTLFLNDNSIKEYRVATGAGDSTPAGEFHIANKLENPTWFKAGAVVPPGSPENLLGTRWLGFDKPGYGIHGTIEPESIGQHVSHGCVRLLNEEVEELYGLIPLGAKVTIVE